MNNEFDILKDKVFSLFTSLARENPAFSDAQMLVASSDAEATLKRSTVRKTIDSEWIDRIEAAIPYLDLVVRRPTSYIEDIDEVLPVELSRHISEKSIKHLAQHTNYIRSVEGDEVTPSKILNVYHDESFLTYENKFVNTLLTRLFAFIDKRYAEIKNTAGTEKNYLFEYSTGFEHADEGSSRTSAKIDLHIELTTPVESGISDADKKNNAAYAEMLARISRLHSTVLGYISSDFSRKLGKNYIRPPVIRTNAILKNKNLNVCLELWQYIESCEKIGYAVMQDDYHEMPSDEYIGALYSSVALQYLTFYNGVASEDANKRLLSEKHLSEMAPEFDRGSEQEDDDEYNVYDAEYKKLVPVSRLMNNTRKLSEGERQVREALDVAIAADRLIEKRRRDEEERIRKEEEAARRRAEAEERRRIAREEARLRREEEKRLAAEAEAKRLAEEAEAKRLAEEAEAKRLAEEAEAKRLAEEAEAKRLAEEAEAKRLAEIAAAERLAKAEAAKRRIAEEQAEARRRAEEEALRRLAARTKIIFADEVTDGRCIDGYKLVPYTRAQYLALSRKKKKKVLTDLRHIREASEARGESALPEERTARENEALRWEDSVKRERNSR